MQVKQPQTISFLTSKIKLFQLLSCFQRSHGATIIRGFNIVKAFIELGTYNTVESLQALCVNRVQTRNPTPHSRSLHFSTNTHVPAPPWAAVAPIAIPITSCNAAADVLIDWFGPGDLKYVVGGHKWWQVRGLDGLDAEWITEREFLEDLNGDETPERKLQWEEEMVLRMEHLETVMVGLFLITQSLLLTSAYSFMSTEVCSQTFPTRTAAHSDVSKARTSGVR
jgi:hypothetical protein